MKRTLYSIALITIFIGLAFVYGSSPWSKRCLTVSGVESESVIQIYWDKSCKVIVKYIDWGVLHPGEVKKVAVYAKNTWNESLVLFSTVTNWDPKTAYLSLFFSCPKLRIQAGETSNLTIVLEVSANTYGFSSFSFDIVYEGRKFIGDIDANGVVDIYDIAAISLAYGSTPESSRWNPYVDLDGTYSIDIYDVALASIDFRRK